MTDESSRCPGTYAVIPQENTIGGPVIDYVDEVLDNEGLSVVGEASCPSARTCSYCQERP